MMFGSVKGNMIDKPLYKNLLKAALFSGCFLFIGCENDPKDIRAWTEDKMMVEEGKNIETLISEGSRLKARLVAPQMLRFTLNDTAIVEFPKTLKVDFYNAVGVIESHLHAKYGKYYEVMNRVFLRDSVVVFNLTGDTLQTPELWWDQNSQMIYTDKKVRIRKGGNLIYGVGMDAKQDLSDVRIRQVTGTLMMPDSLQ